MNRAATIALAPFGALYSAAVKARSVGYQNRFLRTYQVSAPVISVGNLTVGGTGKTPIVEWLAARLADEGRKVCIVTRGYLRENARQQVIVSDGAQILSDVAHSGDEAMMLAQSLLGKSAVVCHADRVAAAAWVIKQLKSDVLLLDDGFQHRRLVRDLDIVTIDATSPFGNGRLLPAGTLREPIKSLSRADCVVLTRMPDEGVTNLVDRVRSLTNACIFQTRMAIQGFQWLDANKPGNDASTVRQPLAAFCGIGNPRAFFEQLRTADLDVRHEATFRDHHKYSQTDIDRLTEQARANGAEAVITTAKDAVKLQSLHFKVPCYVAQIRVEIVDEEKLLELVNRTINDKANKQIRVADLR